METGMTFADFASDYWWLIFPLFFFFAAGWDSWMKYRRHKATLELLKSYAASGKEPPESLMRALDRTSKGDGLDLALEGAASDDSDWRGATPFLVVLMFGLAGIFAYAAHTGMIGLGEDGYFVAMILGLVGFAFLVSALFSRRK